MANGLQDLSDEELDARIQRGYQQASVAPLPKKGTAASLSDEELDSAILGYRSRQEKLMSSLREQAPKDKPTTSGLTYALGPIGYGMGTAWRYGKARERYDKGTATGQDYGVIAHYELEQQRKQEFEKSTGGFLAARALEAPGQIAGIIAGGPAGRLVPGAGVASMGAQLAARTAATPGLWAERAIQQNIEAGRDPLDPKGIPVPAALAALQLAVVSSAGKAGGAAGAKAFPGQGVGQAVGRLGTAAAVAGAAGVVEQAPVDFISGLAEDAVRKIAPEWTAQKSHYGTLGEIMDGNYGDAARQAVAQAMTYAAFGLMQGRSVEGLPKAIAETVDQGRRQGLSVEGAVRPLQEVAQVVQKVAENPDAIRGDVENAFAGLPEGSPARRVGELLAKVFPGAVPSTTNPNTVRATFAGRHLFLEHSPEGNRVRIDFTSADPSQAGVPSELQTGSKDFLKHLRSLVGDLKDGGYGIEYKAIDQGRAGGATSRAEIYARTLQKAGYEQVSGPTAENPDADYVWRPKQAAVAPEPPVARPADEVAPKPPEDAPRAPEPPADDPFADLASKYGVVVKPDAPTKPTESAPKPPEPAPKPLEPTKPEPKAPEPPDLERVHSLLRQAMQIAKGKALNNQILRNEFLDVLEEQGPAVAETWIKQKIQELRGRKEADQPAAAPTVPEGKLSPTGLFERLVRGESVPGLTAKQSQRLLQHIVEEISLEDIGLDQGVSKQAIDQSVDIALEKLHSIIVEPGSSTVAPASGLRGGQRRAGGTMKPVASTAEAQAAEVQRLERDQAVQKWVENPTAENLADGINDFIAEAAHAGRQLDPGTIQHILEIQDGLDDPRPKSSSRREAVAQAIAFLGEASQTGRTKPVSPDPAAGQPAFGPKPTLADRWETEAGQALRDKLGPNRLHSGFDPTILVDAAKWVAAKIIKGGYTFAQWAQDAMRRFGPAIKPFLQSVWGRAAGMIPPVRPTRNRRLPPLQDYAEQKLIASEPRGVARLPGGGILDPRARAREPHQRSIIAYEHSKGVGQSTANRVRAELRGEFGKSAFTWAGPEVVASNGQKVAVGDLIEFELMYPGRGWLTPQQREFVNQWRGILAEAKANALAEGREWVDKDGNPLSDTFFPHTSIETPGGKQGTGYATSGRFFAKESDGIKAGVKYVENEIDRVAEFVRQQYQLSAEHRIANDPDLKAISPTQRLQQEMQKHAQFINTLAPADRTKFVDRLKDKAESLPHSKDQPGPLRRAFAGKIYPDDVAAALVKHFGEKPYGWLTFAENAADAMKAAKLTFDFAAGQIQLAPYAIAHPVVWAKAQKDAFLRLLTNRDALVVALRDPGNREAASLFVQAGGTLGEAPDFLEGTTAGSWLGRVPGYGTALRHFGGTISTLFDIAKLERWKAYLATNPSLDGWVRMAENIENTAGMGRSQTAGVGQGHRVLEKLSVIAPSYYRSFLGQIGDLTQSGTRLSTLRVLGGFVAGMTAISLAGQILSGLDEEEVWARQNPSHPKFWMFSIPLPDGTRQEFGPGGLHRSVLKLVADMVQWVKKGAPTDETQGNPLAKFARSKEGFLLRFLTEALTERDYRGEPQPLYEAVLETLTPSAAAKFLEDGSGWQKAVGIAGEFGGARTFPQSEFDAWKDQLDRAASKRSLRRFHALPLDEQVEIIAANPRPEREPDPAGQLRAAAFNIVRQREFHESLDPQTREILERFNKVAPAHDRTIRVAGVDVPLSRSKEERFKELLLAEYQREVSQWPVTEMEKLGGDQLKKWIQGRLTSAKGVAKARLMQEMMPALQPAGR